MVAAQPYVDYRCVPCFFLRLHTPGECARAAADGDAPARGGAAMTSDAAATGECVGAATDGGGSVSGDAARQPPRGEAENECGSLNMPPYEAVAAALNRGLDNDPPSHHEAPLVTKEATLTTSLGPGPVTYVSEAHAVEFELQARSLDEELPVEMTITRDLAFVDCNAEESGRWDG